MWLFALILNILVGCILWLFTLIPNILVLYVDPYPEVGLFLIVPVPIPVPVPALVPGPVSLILISLCCLCVKLNFVHLLRHRRAMRPCYGLFWYRQEDPGLDDNHAFTMVCSGRELHRYASHCISLHLIAFNCIYLYLLAFTCI